MITAIASPDQPENRTNKNYIYDERGKRTGYWYGQAGLQKWQACCYYCGEDAVKGHKDVCTELNKDPEPFKPYPQVCAKCHQHRLLFWSGEDLKCEECLACPTPRV